MLSDHATYLCFGVARVRQLEAQLCNSGIAVPFMRPLVAAGPDTESDGVLRPYEPHLYVRDLIENVSEVDAYGFEMERILHDRVDEISGERTFCVSFVAMDASWNRWLPASAIDQTIQAAFLDTAHAKASTEAQH